MANPENKQIPYESTQKDIRDAIESVATAIGNISAPSAEDVSYDNSGSGLVATDVQNALDELDALIDSTIASTYKAGGSILFANLPQLIASNVGYVYDVQDAFTTTSDFLEGAGKDYPANTNVAIVEPSAGVYKYDALSGFIDMSQYYTKTQTYTKSETDGLINALDYSDTAVSGSYVTEVDETDGVISVTRESADATPTDSSMKMVTSGGVKTALDLKQNTLTAGDGIDITSDVISVDAEVKSATDTFTTVNGGLLEECNIELEPVQDLHGYDHPWVGGAGKNKLPNENFQSSFSVSNAIFTQVSDNHFKANGTVTGAHFIPFIVNSQGKIPISLSSGTYTLSCSTLKIRCYIYRGADYTDAISDLNYVTSENSPVTGVRFLVADTTFDNEDIYLQLESGSTATSYEPYENICPISGHTEVDLQRDGKNLFDGTLLGGYYESNAFNLGGDANIFKSLKTWLKAGTYTVSYSEQVKIVREIKDGIYRLLGEDTNKWTFTLSQDGYLGLSFRNETSTTWDTSVNIQIEKGNQATPYEPYLGHLYQVQIGSTVYGGSLDIVSGSGEDAYTNIASYNGETINEPWISSMDVYTEGGTPTTGAQVVYPKTTATAISTTPQQIETLVGQNNLSTPLDGQTIDSVKYREVFVFDDVEKVVSLRVPISMLGTDESGRTTASQAYVSGDYFYKDGYMCKALTSISAGATLTLNTNYSQGTLADVLKAIENS